MLKTMICLLFSLSVYADAPMTEELFLQSLADIEKLYDADAALVGKKLSIIPVWQSPSRNAFADNSTDVMTVTVRGGLAWRSPLTHDAFMLIVCHEVGHLFGGTPVRDGSAGILSLEGQADYFATRECFPRFAALRPSPMPPVSAATKQLCLEAADRNICARTMFALSSLGQFLGGDVSIFRHNEEVVQSTLLAHPSAQCRIDTSVAGALGRSRPACWFTPQLLE